MWLWTRRRHSSALGSPDLALPVVRAADIYSNTTHRQGRPLRPSVNQYRAVHPDPTRLITFRDFLENRQGLECYCPGCRRTAWTDVAMLVSNGLGDREVKRYRPRCRKCGSVGIWSFSGPLPTSTGATWMQ
jgi:hypothetical protein